MHREEVVLVQHKARVSALQEQVRALEEAASYGNTDKTRTLKELSAERGDLLQPSMLTTESRTFFLH